MSETLKEAPDWKGPDYPSRRQPDGTFSQENGMSLRDWFAGQAIVAFAHMVPRDQSPFEKEEKYGFYKRRAIWAYAMADAMLAERAK